MVFCCDFLLILTALSGWWTISIWQLVSRVHCPNLILFYFILFLVFLHPKSSIGRKPRVRLLVRFFECVFFIFIWVVSRSAKWGGPYLGGSSWNRPQRPNPGHLRDCWGCLGRFLGRLGHRTTAIVSTRGVGKSLEFRPGAPGDFFQVDRNARE